MVLGVIPARFGSTRFPGKPLARLNGKPMIQMVWERAGQAQTLDRLLVATDEPRILEAVQGFGGEAVMTSREAASGTDRIWEATKQTPAELIVNIQADEPLVKPEMVDQLVEALQRQPEAEMATLRYPRKDPEGFTDPNLVKVVTDSDGWALGFSRGPISPSRHQVVAHHPQPPGLPSQTQAARPGFRPVRAGGAGVTRNPKTAFFWYKHIGLYAYRREILERFVQWPRSESEKAERLEQWRALEHGVRIKVLDSLSDTVGVDTPEDLSRVEALLKGRERVNE